MDFAYAVHTSVGHRCRGARRWRHGAAQHPLQNGQTVEITTVKEGRPRATGSMPSWAISPATAPRPRCAPGSTPRPRTKPWPVAARRSENCCSARARRRSSWMTWPPSWASSRPMRCLKWSARTSSRCATSKTCCARPSLCCSPTNLLLKKPAPMNLRPKAGCWWWASIR